MNVEHAPTTMTESLERHSYTRLHGRWLLLARGIWTALVILTLAIYLAGLPVYFAHYQTICSGAACDTSQLSPDSAKTLQGFGLSVTAYAEVSLLLAVVIALVW